MSEAGASLVDEKLLLNVVPKTKVRKKALLIQGIFKKKTAQTLPTADSKYTCCYRLLDWLAKPLIIYKSTEKRLEPNA